MVADIKVVFQKRVENAFIDFTRKMEQNKLFQVQEVLSTEIIKEIKKDTKLTEKIPAIAVYDSNNLQLRATGKTYKNALEEKIFTDGYRVFEEFLNEVFTNIFSVFPYLLLEKKGAKREITIPFDYIFTSPNIEGSKALLIENRVKSYLQSDNILTILDRFRTTFDLKMTVDETQKLSCQRIALLRNIITHNNSIINEIYINSITKFDIQGDVYTLDQSILPDLETEINTQRIVLDKIVQQISQDLEHSDNLQKLEQRNNSLAQ